MIQYRHSTAGTTGTGTYLYTLPNSYAWGEEVVVSTTADDDTTANYFGPLQLSNGQGNTVATAWVKPYDANRFTLVLGPAVTDAGSGSTSTQDHQSSTIFALDNTEINLRGTFSAPIAGRTSGFRSPASAGLNAPVVAVVRKNGGSHTANLPIITWTTEKDTADAFDTVTGEFVVPSPGDYLVHFQMNRTVVGAYTAFIR